MENKRTIGKRFEDLACAYLMNNKHVIVERNYRVGRLGEIDMITAKDRGLYFVEVKGRRSTNFGTPAEAVGFKKQRKIRQIASIYLQNTSYSYQSVHFIIVEIMLNGDAYEIKLIQDAF